MSKIFQFKTLFTKSKMSQLIKRNGSAVRPCGRHDCMRDDDKGRLHEDCIPNDNIAIVRISRTHKSAVWRRTHSSQYKLHNHNTVTRTFERVNIIATMAWSAVGGSSQGPFNPSLPFHKVLCLKTTIGHDNMI